MKPIARNEILGLADYETIRPRFRARVIEEKKHRRASVGPRASVLFENRDTVLLQIQEMLRTERITREAAIAHEIETYNAFIPGDAELSCTLMLEIDDKDERDAFLLAARGLESAVAVGLAGEKHPGQTTPDRILPDRASAVIYLRIPIGEAGVAALRARHTPVTFVIDHPAYRASVDLPQDVVASLAEDFADAMFVYERPVRFDEVDAARIVFFARYLSYAHEAMEALFGGLAGGYVRLIHERHIGLPAVHVSCDFRAPLRFGDVVRIETHAARIGNKSVTFRYDFFRKQDGVSVATVEHVCAVTDLDVMRAVAVPDDMRALLEKHRT